MEMIQCQPGWARQSYRIQVMLRVEEMIRKDTFGQTDACLYKIQVESVCKSFFRTTGTSKIVLEQN